MTRANAQLAELLDRCRDREIWVFGDLMLDEYVHGPVDRISPEAPVPVVRVDSVEYRLGGAANVAGQVAALGARATLAGPTGADWAGDKLLELCNGAGIDTRCVVPLADRRTTRKLRVLGQGQQLLRLDWEEPAACPEEGLADLFERLEAAARPDVIILSDYAKEAITPASVSRMVQLAARLGARVIVDPKAADFANYRGADVLTPNLAELSLAVGRRLGRSSLEEIAAAARRLMESVGLPAMVVTLSERGLMVLTSDGGWRHVPPSVRRAVRDVTGAGDTVIATLATAIAAGATLPQAAEIANTAGGLAVREIGAVAVGADQIRDALGGQSGAKLLGRERLAARASQWRAGGKRIVLTNGCFDILHAGHLSLLQQAAELGDVLVVAMNSDASVRRLKGPERPVMTESDRARLVAALECVDAVTLFDEDTPLATVDAVRPDVLVKGQDYAGREVVGRELVEGGGGKVVLLPILEGRSSTSVVEKIRVSGQHH